jgi:DNA-binding NtrC family response regulator
MNVLILDDETHRHEAFDKQYGGCTVYHAYNLEQFRKHLRATKFDVISLDHDLGTRETGQDAAKAITSLRTVDVPELCIVHSWFEPGAKEIYRILYSAGIKVEIRRFACRDNPEAT